MGGTEVLAWAITVPLLGALAALVWPRRAPWIGVAASGGALLAATSVAYRVGRGELVLAVGGWPPGLGIALRADPLAAALLVMNAAVATGVSVYATSYFERRPQHFWSLWLLLLTGLHALLLSGGLFNAYVALELVGLSAVALTALGEVRAAWRYLMVSLLGSLAFFAGVALVYLRYGVMDLSELALVVEPDPATWAAMGLATGGLLAKCALFPLHFWLPPAHAGAPAPVSAALSALVVKAAFYLVARVWLGPFAPLVTPPGAWLLGLLGATAVLWGAWSALTTHRLKRLAAYSTVSQIGYLFLFIPLLHVLPPGEERNAAFGALVMMALTHGFAKSALFLAAGVIQRSAGHDRIADLGGAVRGLPITTFSLALAGIALIGLPPSGAFIAKWQLMSAALSAGMWAWIAVVVAGSVLAAAYVFRVLHHAFGPGRSESGPIPARLELIPLLLALVATAVLGLSSGPLYRITAFASLAGGGP